MSTDVEQKGMWKECYTVDEVHLPTGYYFGFSAATGDLSDAHDIISVRLYQLDAEMDYARAEERRSIVPFAKYAEEERPHIEDAKPSPVSQASRKFLRVLGYIILGAILVVALGFGGMLAWNYWGNRDRRKRFY